MSGNFVVGICGGSASGKTKLTKELVKYFQKKATFLSQDNYYKGIFSNNSFKNFDHPSSVDFKLLNHHVKNLKKNTIIEQPLYDFTIHCRTKNTAKIFPNKIIIIEGMLIFSNQNLMRLIDYKIFIDCDSDIRLIRRIKRDISERKRNIDSILSQYEEDVIPMFKKYIEPGIDKADYVLEANSINWLTVKKVAKIIERVLKAKYER